MKCDKCWHEITRNADGFDKETIFNNWLRLVYYFDHELAEGEITEDTHNQMIDCLVSVKPICG